MAADDRAKYGVQLDGEEQAEGGRAGGRFGGVGRGCRPSGFLPGPEEVLIAAADEAALESAILALPPIFREVVVMRDINGMSYREIADATGAPQGTVMSRLARARAQLADKLGSPA